MKDAPSSKSACDPELVRVRVEVRVRVRERVVGLERVRVGMGP